MFLARPVRPTSRRYLLPLLVAWFAGHAYGADTRSLHPGDDTFVVGDEVVLREPLAGDALVAGGRVEIDATVNGDAVLAAGEVELNGSVDDDLYAAGGRVTIGGSVSESARIAGGEVRLRRGARVAEGLVAAGGRVWLEGDVSGYAMLTGGSLLVDGRVDGEVYARGGTLRIGPNAVIEGDVTFRGLQPAEIAPGATIHGVVRNIVVEDSAWSVWPIILGVLALAWLAGWALVGALLLGLLPNATRRVTQTARARPWLALLTGSAVLLLMPWIIALLLATLIGIPLALLALALYLVLVPLGYLAGIATLGDWLLQRRPGAERLRTGARITAFIVLLPIAAVLTLIPLVGWFAGLLLGLVGMGAILIALTRSDAVPAPS
jgi:cytoskeletal protein CcmA (bactofilin family)